MRRRRHKVSGGAFVRGCLFGLARCVALFALSSMVATAIAMGLRH